MLIQLDTENSTTAPKDIKLDKIKILYLFYQIVPDQRNFLFSFYSGRSRTGSMASE